MSIHFEKGTRVILRCGVEAVVDAMVRTGEFCLIGRSLPENHPHAWCADGSWREDHVEHGLDIVARAPVSKP